LSDIIVYKPRQRLVARPEIEKDVFFSTRVKNPPSINFSVKNEADG